MDSTYLKITFISGLKDIVLYELKSLPQVHMIESGDESIYLLDNVPLEIIMSLRSILNVYHVYRNKKLNPYYIAHHKSLVGDLISKTINQNSEKFKTFKLSCAGAQSKEVRDIQRYITESFKLIFSEEADLEIYIGKSKEIWEVGVRFTKRPLSLRNYKVANIKGGLNPTIAYAMNSFCDLPSLKSYLNIFSGSATLLIEASFLNPNCTFTGFDNNGKTNALAVQNIKSADKLKLIQLKTANIFDNPNLGIFDCITTDLPFGMHISKGDDLEDLYSTFLNYCGKALNPAGKLVVYTTEYILLETLLEQSKFKIIKRLDLKVSTVVSVKTYIYPKIFVCEFR